MYVDSMAPYGVVCDEAAIVAVQKDTPPTLSVIGGQTQVAAVVTVGCWVRIDTGAYRYVEIPDFHYVPTSSLNLWPVQTAEDERGIKHSFDRGHEALRFPDGRTARFTRLSIQGRRKGFPLAVWWGKHPPPGANTVPTHAVTAAKRQPIDQRTLWRRLAYPSDEAWKLTARGVKGVSLKTPPQSQRSVADDAPIQKARMRALSYNRALVTSLRPLEKLYMDFAGPVAPSVLHGFRYYCGVVDASTGYSKKYPCHGETAEVATACLAAYLAEVRALRRDLRTLRELRTAIVRTDQGAAFVSEAFVDFVEQHVQAQWSPACTYSPQQNSHVERMWSVGFAIARVLLIAAKLPRIFHPYAIETADFIYNRMRSKHRGGKSPYELLTDGQQPDVSYLRVFGCACFAYLPPDARKTWSNEDEHGAKLCDRAVEGIYLGPDTRSPGHRVWLTGGKRTVLTSRHVMFDEQRMPGMPSGGVTKWHSVAPPQQARQPVTTASPAGRAPRQVAPRCDQAERPATQWLPTDVQSDMPAEAMPRDGTDAVQVDEPSGTEAADGAQAPPAAVAASRNSTEGTPRATRELPKRASRTGHVGDGRVKKMPRYEPPDPRYRDPTSATKSRALANIAALAVAGCVRYPTHAYTAAAGYATLVRTTAEMGDVSVPANYRDAMRSAHREQWQAAMNAEVAGLMERRVWEVVKLSQVPPGTNILGSHFIYDLRRKADGSINKWKARLVADGNHQRQDRGDFDRIFSTVVKLDTVRAMLVLACAEDLELSSIDVTRAYLYAPVNEELYMRLPPTLPHVDGDGEKLVARLQRSLYGLKQAARQWNQVLVQFLTKWGFVQSTIDTCLFMYGAQGTGTRRLLLAVWSTTLSLQHRMLSCDSVLSETSRNGSRLKTKAN